MSRDANVVGDWLIERDYGLVGFNARLAVERGLAEADWYQCPIPRETLRELLKRRDGPEIGRASCRERV